MMRLLSIVTLLILSIGSAAAATSPAEIVGSDRIAEELMREIAWRQPVGQARLELDNPGLHIALPAGTASFTVDGLTYDPRSGRVAAFIAAGNDGERIRVTGRLRRLVELPVLNRFIAPGETIGARDVERVVVASERLNQAFVADAAELIGRTPRRAIRPAEPVRAADVEMPLLVRKGDLVTILLQTPALSLTAQGKAMENGGKGASIRVTNAKSGRVLDAVVTGSNTVTVAPHSATN
jgi:flagella basal body P-ring formation protein FlgA